MQGEVRGGQQPVTGASVQLYAVGTTGDGSSATALLSPAVTTDGNGNFYITGLYTCPSATTLVYIVATGGNPGLGGTVNNQQLAMMTALGQCGSLTSSTFITVNELTTVAAVYALAPFMQSATMVGSGAGDQAALANAFTLANEYVNTATGTSPGANVPAGMQVPTQALATLADILAPCVNTSGGIAGDGSACGNLMSLTNPGTAPTNTITALLNLANNPTMNTSGLYALAQATGPFQPMLTSAPASFAAALSGASLILYPAASLSFDTEPVGGTAPAQTAILANTTPGAVTLNGISFSGPNAGDFAQTNNCPAMLAQGTYCTISVTFLPTAATTRNGTMQVSAGSGVTTLALTGTGAVSGNGPITLSPTSLPFYLNVPQAVTLTNAGISTLGISSISATTGYSETDTCNGQVSAQSQCTIYVWPTNLATTTGMLTVSSTDTTDPNTVALSTLSYGTTEPLTSAPYPYPGWQQGGGALGFAGDSYLGYVSPYYVYGDVLTLSGPDPNDFQGVLQNNDGNGCSTNNTVQVPVACIFYEGFAPQGPRYRATEAVDSAGNQFLLVGYGAPMARTIFFAPALMNFGNVTVGGSSSLGLDIENGSQQSEDFTVHATPTFATSAMNNSEFSGGTIGPCDAFSSFGTDRGITTNLPQLPFCTSTITFTPKSYGVRQAVLTVTDATGFSASMMVEGTGVAAAPAMPSWVLFGNVQPGSTATQTVTATMSNGDPAVAQVTGTVFSILGAPYCAQGSSSCQFEVQYAPTAPGNPSGTLTVTDVVTGRSSSTTLSATGMPAVLLSNNSVMFLSQLVGLQSLPLPVTITNSGSASLTINSITIGGADPGDFSQTNTCTGSAIAPAGTCTISITAEPSSEGIRSATISVVSNAATSPDMIALSVTGQ